jgi:hypothetical protein
LSSARELRWDGAIVELILEKGSVPEAVKKRVSWKNAAVKEDSMCGVWSM